MTTNKNDRPIPHKVGAPVHLTAADIRNKRIRIAEDFKAGKIGRYDAEMEIQGLDWLEGKEDEDGCCPFCDIDFRINSGKSFDPHID